jgi:type VI secretion system protein ImpL
MNQERDPQRRARIFAFPQQLASVRKIASEFLTEIFRPSRFEEPPLLRGVYFSSGTQEGTPIDRIMASLARTFGIGQRGVAAHSGQGRSYFLTRLLKDVVFEEADLAGANRRLEKQRAWAQRAAYAGAVGVTILAVVAWTTSFTRNQVYVSRYKDRLEDYQQVKSEIPPDTVYFDEIVPRLNALRNATEVFAPFEEEGTPFLMGMGLYQGGSLSEAGQAAYRRELNRVLLPAIRHRLEQHMEIGIGDPDFQYEALKTYLMLGDREHLDPELLELWMALDWSNTFADEPEKQGQLQQHLASLLELGFQPVQLDNELVESVRLSLNQVPLAQLLYGRMKRDYQVIDKRPFRLSDAVGLAGRKVFERSSGEPLEAGLSGLFTYNGYHDYFKKEVKNIARRSSEENWVLDPDKAEMTEPEIDKLQKDLQDLYFADYIRSWKNLLGDISIVSFSNLRHAAEVLDLLSGPTSPMRSLLQAVERNTSLAEPSGLLGQVSDKAGEAAASKSRLARLLQSTTGSDETLPKIERPAEVVDETFEQLDALVSAPQGGVAPIEQLINMVSQLYGQVDAMTAGLGSDALSMAAGSSGADIVRRIQTEASRQPVPVKNWLQQIASNTRVVTMGGARAQLNNEWKSSVLPACQRALANRYPVYRDAQQEMTLADFGRLFGPGGLIDSFFNNNLKPFVNTAGGSWRWKPVGNVSLGIPNSRLRAFQRAALIRDTFFSSGGNQPSVSFGLKPVYLDANVSTFLLDLEGQKFRYRHGPTRTTQATWPNPDSTGQVRIVFEDSSGARVTISKEGPWAWFRMLDRSELKSLSADRIRATFESRGRKATWEIRASSVVNPFMMQALHEFRCPGSL